MKSATIRISIKTKKGLENIMKERGYPTISHTVARIVEGYRPLEDVATLKNKVSLLLGMIVGVIIGVILGSFLVAYF